MLKPYEEPKYLTASPINGTLGYMHHDLTCILYKLDHKKTSKTIIKKGASLEDDDDDEIGFEL